MGYAYTLRLNFYTAMKFIRITLDIENMCNVILCAQLRKIRFTR